MKKLILLFIIYMVILSCNKKQEVQPYTNQSIKGQIFNTCTDSGISDVEVMLVYTCHTDYCGRMGKSIDITDIRSDTKGNFSWPPFAIYNGDVFTLWNSYYGAVSDTFKFNYTNVNQFFKFNAVPKFHTLQVSSNHTLVTSHSDSVSFFMSQNIFHKNMPDSSYTNTLIFFGDQITQQTIVLSNKPMGLWHIKIDKWVSGIHSTIQDSIYLNYWATKAYSINW